MTDEIDDLELDRRVRRVFSPSEDAVRRVIERSLGFPGPGSPRDDVKPHRRLLSVRIGLAILTIVIVTAAIWMGRAPRAQFSVTGEGSRVLIQMPDGRERVMNANEGLRGREHLIIVVQR
jgi:hypothetical protein